MSTHSPQVVGDRTTTLLGLVPVALDLLIPTVGYFALHAAGISDVWALTLAGSATALVTLWHSIRQRRMDLLGVLVVAEIGVAVALAALTHDPRIVLVRAAFYLAVAGVVNLVAAAVDKPLTYAAAIPMATKGDPARLRAYGRAWDSSAEFRHIHRQLAVVIGVGFLVYAAIRVVAVYALSVGEAVLAQEVPGLLLIGVVLVTIRLRVPALRRIVDAEQARGE